MTQLPDRPSSLIRVALADLEAVEKDPRYQVDMGTWHQPTNDGCEVCFAGAVMARTLNAPFDETVSPSEFDYDTNKKLYALDSFRAGNISQGLELMDVPFNMRRGVPSVVPMRGSLDGFKDDMRRLATQLEEVGL